MGAIQDLDIITGRADTSRLPLCKVLVYLNRQVSLIPTFATVK